MLAATCLDDKAQPFVHAVTDTLDCPLLPECDVRIAGQLQAVLERIRAGWGCLDFLLQRAPARRPRSAVMNSSIAIGNNSGMIVPPPAAPGQRLESPLP